jgi:ATP-binding cassette, subfamily B, bacterial CvaB/MchF/RaxB
MRLDLGLMSTRSVRLVRQTEMAECGLATLAMVANYHGLDVDLGTLRRRFAPSLRGASLRTLIAIADGLGFAARAVKLPLESLSHLHMPAVLHWDLNHYVVIERVRDGKALIHDPAGRSRWLALEEVSDHFTGVALELRPTGAFVAADRRERLRLRQLWGKITGAKRALLQVLVLTVIMQAFVLLSPYYMQVAIDRVLPALDLDFLLLLALGFGLFTIFNVVATLLRSSVLLVAGTSMSFGIAANIARWLFRLPVAWFERRHIGDVLSRFQSIEPIQQALTQGAVAALLDGLLAMLTFAVMLFYSGALALTALAAFLLYGLVRILLFSAERDAREDSIVSRGREQSMMIESLRGLVTLRLFGRETLRHALWQAKLANAVNAQVRVGRITNWQEALRTLILGLELVVSIWLAIRLVIGSELSLGMMFAYFAYKTQFLTNMISLIDKGVTFRMLNLHLERLSDIALAEQDLSFRQELPARASLNGKVEFRNVHFRYSPADPIVLDGVDLIVEPGENVAITGPSGGGKSTLVKILLGLVEPDEGELLVDDIPLGRFGHCNYRSQVAAVLQDDSLFAGSLADNISLFDDEPDPDRIIAAASAAAIHDDIERMPMGYETLVGDMGSSLSGGQKQRVFLARALYREPRILVMDEGTAHLDQATERAVGEAIKSLGITRIQIAHRRETVASAHRALVLVDGRLVERAAGQDGTPGGEPS